MYSHPAGIAIEIAVHLDSEWWRYCSSCSPLLRVVVEAPAQLDLAAGLGIVVQAAELQDTAASLASDMAVLLRSADAAASHAGSRPHRVPTVRTISTPPDHRVRVCPSQRAEPNTQTTSGGSSFRDTAAEVEHSVDRRDDSSLCAGSDSRRTL